jgi:predicted RNA-binding protein with PUA-like domain
MAFWIFKYNPEKYHLAERLADSNPDITWTVSRYRNQIAPGDTIFIWETGRDRGIRAILRAEGVPQDMAELESEQPYWTQRDNDVRCRVRATIVRRDVNLSHAELRSTPGLENLSVFHGFQQGSNFPVTLDEGAILLRLAGQTDQQTDH